MAEETQTPVTPETTPAEGMTENTETAPVAENTAATPAQGTTEETGKKGGKNKATAPKSAHKTETALVPAVGTAITNQKGVVFTANSLTLPEKQTFEEWQEVGTRLGQAGEAFNWWVGDWYNAGKDKYEGVEQAVSHLSRQTVMNLASVARRVPAAIRRPALTWTHHEVVAKFHNPANPNESAAKQIALLDIAETEKLNRDDFRARVKQIEEEANKLRAVNPSAPGETGPDDEGGKETAGTPESYVANSRAAIVNHVREHLSWTETQLLMTDLAELLTEQGIVVELNFPADEDLSSAVRIGRNDSTEPVIILSQGADGSFSAESDNDTDNDDGGSQDGSDGQGAGFYPGAQAELERVAIDGDGGGDVDDFVSGMVGGGRGV